MWRAGGRPVPTQATPATGWDVGVVKFFQRIGRFLRQVWSELRKVVWPTRRQTAIFTGVVFLSVVVVAVLTWAFDTIFSALLSLVIDVGS
nr:preprotein translocase subunit SecE [Bacillota bacterium]